MAPRLALCVLLFALSAVAANPQFESRALAAGLDVKGEADANEATRLYKQGFYDDAAKLFARLAADHPEMPIFERNLGACYYYLRKSEPALSHLRGYLNRRKDVPPDDKAVVDRWIEEMEALRAQNAASSADVGEGSAVPPTVAPAPVMPAPAAPIAPAPAPTKVASQPAGVDLTATPPSADTGQASHPIYKTWWFWTGVGAVVVAGTITAVLLANRSSSPCDGIGFACRGVR